MDIIINSSEPIYSQIVNQIKSEILQGKLHPGEALPSIRNLAKELQISVITTKRAYEELEKLGLVETMAGKGTFVAGHNQELLKEKRMQMIEEKLGEVVAECKALGLTFEEVQEILEILYQGEL